MTLGKFLEPGDTWQIPIVLSQHNCVHSLLGAFEFTWPVHVHVAVGVLSLVCGQYYSGITLPALAEESGLGISIQLFPS